LIDKGETGMNKKDLSLYLDQHADELFSIAQELYDNPEISEKEANSSSVLKKLLGIAGLEYTSSLRKNLRMLSTRSTAAGIR
jgi:metal-dependent amidase/aminoacylase/carboxypeptidase family protein